MEDKPWKDRVHDYLIGVGYELRPNRVKDTDFLTYVDPSEEREDILISCTDGIGDSKDEGIIRSCMPYDASFLEEAIAGRVLLHFKENLSRGLLGKMDGVSIYVPTAQDQVKLAVKVKGIDNIASSLALLQNMEKKYANSIYNLAELAVNSERE